MLENVTHISREYGEQLSSRFSQLWRNITGSPHKAFNSQTFTSAAWHFLLLAGLVFAFWWLVRLAALPLYRKMGHWGRHKNRDRSNWLQLPATIAGAFIFDLLLLALTLFVGQLLSDRLNGNNPTIAFQQSLFLNAFALIEFFKAILRLIFCPRIPEQPDWLRAHRRGADYLQPGQRPVWRIGQRGDYAVHYALGAVSDISQ